MLVLDNVFLNSDQTNSDEMKKRFDERRLLVEQGKIHSGICSDGSALGNPGIAACRVTNILGESLYDADLGYATNNFAELCGIEAMIDLCIAEGTTENRYHIMWTDSQTCLLWIKNGNVGKTVSERETVVKMVRRIRQKLIDHPDFRLHKWRTDIYGEIPADFGNK